MTYSGETPDVRRAVVWNRYGRFILAMRAVVIAGGVIMAPILVWVLIQYPDPWLVMFCVFVMTFSYATVKGVDYALEPFRSVRKR